MTWYLPFKKGGNKLKANQVPQKFSWKVIATSKKQNRSSFANRCGSGKCTKCK